MNLFQELKRRKVFNTVGVYAAASLIIIQVADIVFPRLLLPDWTVTFVIVLVILGFPITFFLSWTYDLKHDNTDNNHPHDQCRIRAKCARRARLPSDTLRSFESPAMHQSTHKPDWYSFQ